MALWIAVLLLAAFVANVAYGSVSGSPPLGVVAEAVLLLAASIAFVVTILRREARDKEQAREEQG